MEPIRPRKLSDDVQERLLKLIQEERLQPGDFIPSERELMAALNVGRPSIREAMQSLQRLGVVDIRHGERARVSAPSAERILEPMVESVRHFLTHSPASLEHLKEARAIFEMEMVSIAARKRTKADIDRLTRNLELQKAAQKDSKRFRELDGEFHREIAAITGNPILVSVSAALFQWLTDFHVDLVQYPGLEKTTLAEHRAILEAIVARDPAKAPKAMRDHLYRANAVYRQNRPAAQDGGRVLNSSPQT